MADMEPDATESTPGLYRDWMLLQLVDDELRGLLERYDMTEMPTDDQARAQLVDRLLEALPRWPAAWTELLRRLYTDAQTDQSIALAARKYARDDATREAVVSAVKAKLVVVSIRNARNWHEKGNHAKDWKGFVLRHIPQLVQRASKEVRGIPTSATVEQADNSSPADAVLRAEAETLLNEAIATLSEHERDLVMRHYWEQQNVMQISKSLGLPYSTVADRVNAALAKLRQALESRGWRGGP